VHSHRHRPLLVMEVGTRVGSAALESMRDNVVVVILAGTFSLCKCVVVVVCCCRVSDVVLVVGDGDGARLRKAVT
jgi:hypothetical protein